MSRVAQINSTVYFQFEVYDSADAPVDGLVKADFTYFLSRDSVDTATTSVDIGAMNFGTQAGRYYASINEAIAGAYRLVIRHATYNLRGWAESVDLTADGNFLRSMILASPYTPLANDASGFVTTGAVAAGAVTSIQSGLATSAALATVDTVVDAILVKTDVATSTRATPADIAAIPAAPTANQNADALLDRANAIEDVTVREALTTVYDVLAAGESTGWGGGASSGVAFAKKDGSGPRLVADFDQHGNRSNIVLDDS